MFDTISVRKIGQKFKNKKSLQKDFAFSRAYKDYFIFKQNEIVHGKLHKVIYCQTLNIEHFFCFSVNVTNLNMWILLKHFLIF